MGKAFGVIGSSFNFEHREKIETWGIEDALTTNHLYLNSVFKHNASKSHIGSLLDLLEDVPLLQSSFPLPVLTALSGSTNTSPNHINHIGELLFVLVGVG